MSHYDINKLIIIGNGFDLAHGLKTSYKDFLDWYMCNACQEFLSKNYYGDSLIEMTNKFPTQLQSTKLNFLTSKDVIDFIQSNAYYSIKYKSNFFNRIITSFNGGGWVDIERYYYKLLKTYFSNNSFNNKTSLVNNLNNEFDFLINKLIEYIKIVNEHILETPKLNADSQQSNFNKLFLSGTGSIKVINFNYTETLNYYQYVNDDDVIYIHGRVAEMKDNPIIFGYGDESDPDYQAIEDSGENMYLEHIKSFGYFRVSNYSKLLGYIDLAPFSVYILGHSCGLSDRVLLNQIFEHSNCKMIDIFYHSQSNETDNFKEITQQISRHFKPQNKNMMRRRIADKNIKNIIPQKIVL